MNTHLNPNASLITNCPVPLNELARLQTLQELDILDTCADPVFDAAVRQAASICETPVALISLIDRDQLWFKAQIGLHAQQSPRSHGFCAHTILGTTLLEVPDALADQRFVDNALVTGEPALRFYAGMPLMTSDGLALGALAVMDREPRTLNAAQRVALQDLARLVESHLKARKLMAESTQLGAVLNEAFDEIYALDPASRRIQFANARALENLGYAMTDLQQLSLSQLGADYPLDELQNLCDGLVRSERASVNFDARHIHKDGSSYAVNVRATASPSPVSPQVFLLVNRRAETQPAKVTAPVIASVDPVSQLPDLASFDASLTHSMNRVDESGKPLALMMIEIGQLAPGGDARRLAFTDRVIADFAARLKGSARSPDVVAHLGEATFAILVEGVDDMHALPSMVARIQRKMERGFHQGQAEIALCANIGVVYFCGGDEAPAALLLRGGDAANMAIQNGTRRQVAPLPQLVGNAAMKTCLPEPVTTLFKPDWMTNRPLRTGTRH